MTEVSQWDKIDEKNLSLDELGLSNSAGSYWQKMMGALARKFGVVDAKLAKVEGALVNRGRKTDMAALEAVENPSVGDYYTLDSDGSEWAWNGTEWYEVGNDDAIRWHELETPARLNELNSMLHIPIYIDGETVGTEFYVDGTNGDDNIGNGSQESPWKTIAYAAAYIAENYNINNKEVSINVAGGTYTEQIVLSEVTSTTGHITIKPASQNDVVSISKTLYTNSSVVLHTGGPWILQSLSLQLILGEQIDAQGHYFYLVRKDTPEGSLLVESCNLQFVDNTLPPASGVRKRCYGYGLLANGGEIGFRNTIGNQTTTWSGTQTNSWFYWMQAEPNGILGANTSGSADCVYNVSGNFHVFVRARGGIYTTRGTGGIVYNAVDSPTGKRFIAEGGGRIITGVDDASAVAAYFPGDSDGTYDSATYSFISPTPE